ncbi:conserved hypothetical protein [gamma proteobacterium HdN1]|nr:conserved hypothetical protein [gamma proteobacterium HdN1]
MKRVHILVEGQTEESFVRELLAPYYAQRQVFITAIVVRTSAGHKGGIASYAKVRPQIVRLCKQDRNVIISTMFDLYGLPADFPGKNSQAYTQLHSGLEKAQLIENALVADIQQNNFIPYIQLHEFEALLFADLKAFEVWTDNDRVLKPIYELCESTKPEDINDSPQTAPSKRILSAMPNYQKTVHGPLIACDIGLDAIRRQCPHFSRWLVQLDALA